MYVITDGHATLTPALLILGIFSLVGNIP